MGRWIKLFAAVAMTTGWVGSSHAYMQGGVPVYVTIYYSDSTYEHDVGIINLGSCTYIAQTDGVQYVLTGTQTAYGLDHLAGYCSQGDYYPI